MRRKSRYWPGKHDGFPDPHENTKEAAEFAWRLHHIPKVFFTYDEAAWFAEREEWWKRREAEEMEKNNV